MDLWVAMFWAILNSAAINIYIYFFSLSVDLSLFSGNNLGVEFLGFPKTKGIIRKMTKEIIQWYMFNRPREIQIQTGSEKCTVERCLQEEERETFILQV